MPSLLKLSQITDYFNGNDEFSKSTQDYTYDAVIKEITSAVNSSAPPDVIYVGIGVGNPTVDHFGSNPTIFDPTSDDKIDEIIKKVYDLQCFPAFLSKYNNPLCICINRSLNISGKSFESKVKVITEGFPLKNTDDIDLTSLQGKIDMPVIILSAINQNDYPGIGNFAWKLGAIYLKSFAKVKLGSIDGYYKFITGKSRIIKGIFPTPLELKDEELLTEINNDINS